ncbi:hypothetical protein DIPPA_10832 [Diplonema papillatum]|nr:hypothetical protein DIPPA_10832 [Diplonema papillatum]|eukprot:gene5920-9067_t
MPNADVAALEERLRRLKEPIPKERYEPGNGDGCGDEQLCKRVNELRGLRPKKGTDDDLWLRLAQLRGGHAAPSDPRISGQGGAESSAAALRREPVKKRTQYEEVNDLLGEIQSSEALDRRQRATERQREQKDAERLQARLQAQQPATGAGAGPPKNGAVDEVLAAVAADARSDGSPELSRQPGPSRRNQRKAGPSSSGGDTGTPSSSSSSASDGSDAGSDPEVAARLRAAALEEKRVRRRAKAAAGSSKRLPLSKAELAEVGRVCGIDLSTSAGGDVPVGEDEVDAVLREIANTSDFDSD